jgi:hypothetical protein
MEAKSTKNHALLLIQEADMRSPTRNPDPKPRPEAKLLRTCIRHPKTRTCSYLGPLGMNGQTCCC